MADVLDGEGCGVVIQGLFSCLFGGFVCQDLKDVDGYKSTTYYAGKNESGYGMTGLNTSSSVGNIYAMEKE